MTTRKSAKSCSLATLLGAYAVAASMLSACTTSMGKMGEPNTLHAGEVVQVLTQADILSSKEVLSALRNAGVSDSSIHDGSVVVVRNMCCGPPKESAVTVDHNPQSLPLTVGDVVEVQYWSGAAGSVNTVTRVLQSAKQANGPCWWNPKNDLLWRRVMYCDWMPQQGWVKQEGLNTGWYKPASTP